jgi:hypothetical protein
VNILSIDFVSALIISGLMFTLFRGRKTFQKVHVLLTEQMQKKRR